MQIFIQTLSDAKRAYFVKINDTVESLKKEIYNREGIAPQNQRLVYAGKTLDKGA